MRALRGARRPFPLLASVSRFLPLGELDGKLALARLSQSDRSLEAAWTLPEVGRPGAIIKVRARVRASSGRLASSGTLSISARGASLARVALPALPQDGTSGEVEASVTLPETT